MAAPVAPPCRQADSLARQLEVRQLEVRQLEVRQLEVRQLEVRQLEVRQLEVRQLGSLARQLEGIRPALYARIRGASPAGRHGKPRSAQYRGN